MSDSTNGRLVVVTGAASGIGASCARTLAREGYIVGLLDRNEKGLNGIEEELRSEGLECISCAVDLLDDRATHAAVEKCAAAGTLAGLVNAAGVHSIGNALSITLEEWDRVVGIKLRGYFVTSRAVLPHLCRNGGGSIVNLASVSGRTKSMHGSPAYAASNAGVIGLTMTMAAQGAAHGIRINCVAPGLIETPMLDLYTTAQKDAMTAATPMKRTGRPDEIASVVSFLMSDKASFVTGETINANGGVFMV